MKTSPSVRRRLVLPMLMAFLIPVAPGLHGEEEGAQPTEVAVHVGKVIRTTLHAYLNTYGLVAPEPAASGRAAGAADLTAPVTGLVRDVLVSEGQMVKAGDLLVRLEDRMAAAGVDRARARLLLARQGLERQGTLLEQRNTSEKSFQEAQRALALAQADLTEAQGALSQVQLRSPLDGVVARILVAPGQSVDLNRVVARVVDLGRLVVVARVPSESAGEVAVGQSAELLMSEPAAEAIQVSVSFVSPTVDTDTGTVRVRLSLPANSGLRPGNFVRLRIAVREVAQCLAVPRDSVYVAADGQSTLSVVENNTAHKRVIRVGLEEGRLIQVEGEGLQEGMTVVTTGSYALPAETRVRILPASEGNGGQ